MVTCEEVAEDLFKLIKPYYKNMRSQPPDFRKSLKATEVEDILQGVHDIVKKLKEIEYG